MHEVGDDIAGLFGSEGLEEAFGHDGVFESTCVFDLGSLDGCFFGETAKGDGAVGGGGDDAAEGTPVVELENDHAVFGGNDGAGVDDVLQKIAEIGAAGAGEVGTEFAAVAVEDVAGATEIFEEDAASGEVGFFASVFAERFVEFFDAFLFRGVGLTKITPDFLEAGGEFFVVQGEGLTGVEGGEVVAGDGAVFDLRKQGVGPSRAGNDDVNDGAFFIGTKIGVAIEERLCDGRIVKGGEAADSGLVEVANFEELLADLAEIIGTGVNEALQGGLAVAEGGVVIEGDFPERIHGAAIAENDGELPDEIGVGLGKLFDCIFPVCWAWCFSPAFVTFEKTLKEVRGLGWLGGGDKNRACRAFRFGASVISKKIRPSC